MANLLSRAFLAFAILGVTSTMLSSFEAGASVKMKLTDQRCIQGDEETRFQTANAQIEAILKKPTINIMNTNASDVLEKGQERMLLYAISVAMRQNDCGFTPNAKFKTIGDAITSLANESYKAQPDMKIPKWLKPGFYAKISTTENDNSIFIEMTSMGFIFHHCVTNTSENVTGPAPPATPDCPVLGNGAVYTPVDELLKKTNGAHRALVETMKAMAGTTALVTSSMQYFFVMAPAQVAVNFFNPTPLETYQNDNRVHIAIRDLLKMGAIGNEVGGDIYVVRVIPGKYQDLEDAVNHTIDSIFAKEFKRLKEVDRDLYDVNAMITNPALTIEVNAKDKALQDLRNWQAKKAAQKNNPANGQPGTPADGDDNDNN